MRRRHRCRRCGDALRPEVLEGIQGRAGPVEVRLAGYPVLICGSGHRRHARSDPAPDVLHAIVDGTSPPWRRGQRGRPRCACGAGLAELPESPGRFHLVAEVPEGPVTIDVAGPAVTCPACGRRYLAGHQAIYDEALPNALVAAFDAAGVER